MKTPNKKISDKIMCDIVFKYRENQKRSTKIEKVNLFPIFRENKLTYAKFIDIIYSLEAQGYIKMHPESKSKNGMNINNEIIYQEFVTIEPKYFSFPEDLEKHKIEQIKTNIKYPIIVSVLSIIITTPLSSTLQEMICKILELILSLFHS